MGGAEQGNDSAAHLGQYTNIDHHAPLHQAERSAISTTPKPISRMQRTFDLRAGCTLDPDPADRLDQFDRNDPDERPEPPDPPLASDSHPPSPAMSNKLDGDTESFPLAADTGVPATERPTPPSPSPSPLAQQDDTAGDITGTALANTGVDGRPVRPAVVP